VRQAYLVLDVPDQCLEFFLELSAYARSGDNGGEVQRKDSFVLKRLVRRVRGERKNGGTSFAV